MGGYILLGIILFGFIFLFVISPMVVVFENNIKNSKNYGKLLEDKFEKEIKKVSEEEQKLYRKVFNNIVYNEARFWSKDWHGVSTEIAMKNLKVHARLNNDNEYTCWGITIVNNKKDFITIYTPEGQQKLFNIFSDYAVWKWDMYMKELDEERDNEAIKEHRNNIKKANKFLK